MFGIGFSEFLIIAIVAIVIVGPERLPGMARTIGRFAWEMRRAWDDVRQTVRDEVMQASEPFEDIRKAGEQIRKSALDTTESFRRETEKFKQTAEKTVRGVEQEVTAAAKGETAGPSPAAPAPTVRQQVDVGTAESSSAALGALATSLVASGAAPKNEASPPNEASSPNEQALDAAADEQDGDEASMEAVGRKVTAPKRAQPAVEYFDLDGNLIPRESA